MERVGRKKDKINNLMDIEEGIVVLGGWWKEKTAKVNGVGKSKGEREGRGF